MVENTQTIFIVYNDLGIGGVQRKIADIVDFISSSKKFQGIQLCLILDHKRAFDLDEDIFMERVRKTNVKIFYRPQENIWRIKFPYSLYLLWKSINLKPKVMLAFMDKYSILAVVVKMLLFWIGIKVIISYDNVPSLLIPVEHKNILRVLFQKSIIRFLYPKADLIILPSNEARKDIKTNFGIPKSKLAVNKNWTTVYSDSNNNNFKYDLIYTGRVDPVKNLADFVEIVGMIKQSTPKVKACIVGWGDEIDKISNLIYENSLHSSIDLAGSQQNIRNYLINSKVFLLTSYFEGLPISALEAMANGLPVIALKYPGVEELIVESKNGFICNDIIEATNRANYLLNNEVKRKEIGNWARKYVEREHGKDALKSFVNSIVRYT